MIKTHYFAQKSDQNRETQSFYCFTSYICFTLEDCDIALYFHIFNTVNILKNQNSFRPKF